MRYVIIPILSGSICLFLSEEKLYIPLLFIEMVSFLIPKNKNAFWLICPGLFQFTIRYIDMITLLIMTKLS